MRGHPSLFDFFDNVHSEEDLEAVKPAKRHRDVSFQSHDDSVLTDSSQLRTGDGSVATTQKCGISDFATSAIDAEI